MHPHGHRTFSRDTRFVCLHDCSTLSSRIDVTGRPVVCVGGVCKLIRSGTKLTRQVRGLTVPFTIAHAQALECYDSPRLPVPGLVDDPESSCS